MKTYRSFNDPSLRRGPRFAAIGVFDGIHLGHRKVLGTVLERARRARAVSMAILIDPHPEKVLVRERPSPSVIMSLGHRLRSLEAMGFDEALILRFDKRFSRVTRERFLEEFLVRRLGVSFLAVGHDFRFGRGGKGDAAYLRRESRRYGFAVWAARPFKRQGEIVSSTRIRERIAAGQLRKAAQMLGRPVSVLGTVVHGRSRGRKIGFPTANLDPHHEVLPPAGVYAAYGYLDGHRLRGVIHIGPRPTFHDRLPSLEVHFLDFHKNVYGRELELVFLSKLRATERFGSAKELIRAIYGDIRKAKKIFAASSRR